MNTQSHTPSPKRVLCLAGSLRRDSWNRHLLRAALHAAPDGLKLALYDDLADVPMFNEDTEEPVAPAVQHLRHAVAMADGLLIATPEYNHSFPGVLKNAIDWLSRGSDSVLIDKPVAVIGVSGGSWGTRLAQAALRQVLTATEARVMPAPMLFVAHASERFDAVGLIHDSALAKALSDVIGAFGEWIVLQAQAVGSATSTPAAAETQSTTTPGIIENNSLNATFDAPMPPLELASPVDVSRCPPLV
jgi:chromate reductase